MSSESLFGMIRAGARARAYVHVEPPLMRGGSIDPEHLPPSQMQQVWLESAGYTGPAPETSAEARRLMALLREERRRS